MAGRSISDPAPASAVRLAVVLCDYAGLDELQTAIASGLPLARVEACLVPARAALAAILLARVDVLLLDEPTNNLDPASRAEVLAAIADPSFQTELGRFNINVNAVAPGWVETEMTKEAAERAGLSMEDMKEQFAKGIPLKRFGKPEDIAGVVSFLVSDDASYISGETLYVAGGPSSSVI